MSNLYQDVTARILTHLENGVAPWVKPWSATPGQNMPHNAATGRPYSGANVVLLWMAGAHFAEPRYLTFKQAKALGGNVKRGEHGFQVVFVKPMKGRKNEETGEAGKNFMMLKAYTVFNVEQCENLPARIVSPEPVKPRHDNERDATIDEFIALTGCDYRDGRGGDRAYYSPAGDFVAMPAFEAFTSANHYYATAFHELGHWTGHKNRLDRDMGKRFGSDSYAAEELVAELCAAFLCAEFNIDGMLQHNAAYLKHWAEIMKADNKAFFTAASAAQKAADFMRSKLLAEAGEAGDAGEAGEAEEPAALAA
jgi:antirestriction protein ArdC